MKLYGLIGYPLSHSFSKKYFTERFAAASVTDCQYENFPIATIGQVEVLLKNNPHLQGFNITIPYKEQIIPYLHGMNEVVRATGACNCIKIEDNKFYGYNTDTIGFEQTLKKKLKPSHRKALVLGTGGAAKAVSYVLSTLNIEPLSVSRGKGSAITNSITYEALTEDIIRAHTLIINTTPLGMFPEINQAPPIPYELLSPEHYLYDLIYNPGKTLFLQKGESMGAAVENGFDMLIIQAEESWKIWNTEY